MFDSTIMLKLFKFIRRIVEDMCSVLCDQLVPWLIKKITVQLTADNLKSFPRKNVHGRP